MPLLRLYLALEQPSEREPPGKVGWWGRRAERRKSTSCRYAELRVGRDCLGDHSEAHGSCNAGIARALAACSCPVSRRPTSAARLASKTRYEHGFQTMDYRSSWRDD
jgi:hypothetical protein